MRPRRRETLESAFVLGFVHANDSALGKNTVMVSNGK